MFFPPSHLKWMCQMNKVSALSSAGNLVKWQDMLPQAFQKQHWVHFRHFSGTSNLQIAPIPSMIHTKARHLQDNQQECQECSPCQLIIHEKQRLMA